MIGKSRNVQIVAILGLCAVLAACGSSNSSTADAGGSAGTPAAAVVANGPGKTVVPTGSVSGASTSTSSTAATPATTNTTPVNTTTPVSTPVSSSSSNSTLPPATSDTVTLSWTAPTDNTNGTALTNLAGYQINYGTSPSAMTQQISVNTVGVMNYVVSNLSSGTWYFEVVAVNSAGAQSAPTSVVSTTI